MKRVYIAISLNGRVSWAKRVKFIEFVGHVSKKLTDEDFEVVNLNTGGVRECPNAGFFECVRFSDSVLCICDEASSGFGETVWSAMQRLFRRGLVFIPSNEVQPSLDLAHIPIHPLITRVTFQTLNDISMFLRTPTFKAVA